ncbi:MAG TPA: HAMP domain-containing sensor histidine kinase, partial [Planctomycetota bacterium]|nr:HAMP domain-containing sensor histidine kinase [Planctomycetota bacterium]
GRFTALAPAFDPTDYAVAGYRGWLSSPGDLLLTTAAVLLVAVGLARGILGSRPPAGAARRALAAAAGIAMAAVATRGWISLVEGAPANGRVEVFGHGPLWPTLARGILLSALLLATAAAWTFVRSGLRLVVTSLGGARPRLASVVAAVAAAAAAVALSRWGEPPLTAWGVLLLPGAAALLGRLAAGDPRPGAPTRMLLVSLLAVALLFPVLWVAAADDDRSDLVSEVGALVRGPEDTEAQLPTQLRPLAEDPILVRALERYTDSGGSDEGLALHAWRRLHPSGYGEAIGAVFVHDGEGRRISRFAIEMPPFRRLPEPRPGGPSEDGDVTVTMSRGKGEVLAATTGSLRILSPVRAVVGYVSVVVPDPVAVRLAGLAPRLTSRLRSENPEAIMERPLELALVRADRVVQSTDPTMPRRGPPPVDVSEGAPEWRPATDGGRPWLVVSAGERGTVIARAPPLTFEDGLVAAARMAVVGVGLGGALALLALLVGIRAFRMRLRDKILWSFVAISALPLVALAVTNRSDAVARADEEFRVRQTALARDARREIQGLTEGQVAELGEAVEAFAALRGQDLTAYVDGRCLTSTVQSLVDAEILPSLLDASVYRATEIEGRDLVARDEIIGGRTGVRILYTPLRDPLGRIAATLAVPLVFDSARVEEAASRSGSVLFAAYLLALLLVVIAGLWTARGLTKPIEQLAQGTRRVAAGELDATIGTAGRGEIGDLIADFDRMTADLRRARERAAVAERETAWRGMARQIAHEIKNPLTPMKLMLQQLLATARSDPRYATEMIEPTARVVLEQIDGLSRIAGDFAAFARFPPRALRDVDVDDVLRSVALLYAGGESSPVRVETDLGGGLPAVRWDEDEIRRVYMNLVANAVESRADGQPIVRVTIRSRPGKVPGSGREGVVVTVVDDGVGIPPENRERLFHPSFSTKTHGTGLGLAIVRRIVTDLGGEIRIESEPGRGTRVTTWLPSAGPGASPTVG